MLKDLKQIIKELGGGIVMLDNRIDIHMDMRVVFVNNGKAWVDDIYFLIYQNKNDFGITLTSQITGNKKVNLAEYTYLLVNRLEFEFSHNVKLGDLTQKYYFNGELICNNLKKYK